LIVRVPSGFSYSSTNVELETTLDRCGSKLLLPVPISGVKSAFGSTAVDFGGGATNAGTCASEIVRDATRAAAIPPLFEHGKIAPHRDASSGVCRPGFMGRDVSFRRPHAPSVDGRKPA
jgi:hypothetical protein